MGTTNARTTPALWTTLATLTLLTAGCTKPEAPPTVQATTPPPREQHPLLVMAARFGRDPGPGGIIESWMDEPIGLRSANVGELEGTYFAGAGLSTFIDLKLGTETAIRNRSIPIKFRQEQECVAAANEALALFAGGVLDQTWAVKTVDIPEPGSARNEGAVTVTYRQAVNGYLVTGANLARVRLVGDTLEPIAVTFIDRYKPEPLEINCTVGQAAEVAKEFIRLRGKTPVRATHTQTSYLCGNIRGSKLTKTRNDKQMKLVYTFKIDVEGPFYQEVGVHVTTGDVVLFTDTAH